MHFYRTIKHCCCLMGIVLFVSSCVSVRVRHAVPRGLEGEAQISGMQDIRAMYGRPSSFLVDDYIQLLTKEQREGSLWDAKGSKTFSVLAISGGAANGAYGVGFLNGWSKEGSRPVFEIVTGVSTGAVIAPFAFIGSKYDEDLKQFYTKYSTKEIMRRKGLLQILFGNSYMSSRPLEKLIDRHFDRNLLSDVAKEYNKGRRLYVGTTNLDAQEFVIWDMGKIATYGDEKALKLFRKIILASVTMPLVFPPLYFDVEINRQKYDEMHVDGGATKQIFFLYNILQDLEKALTHEGLDLSKVTYKIYIIRNGYVTPVWKEVPDNIFSIAERTFDTSTNAQGVGDLYQLYTFAHLGRGDFNLAYIPSTHIPNLKEMFDLSEMKALFDLGFNEASQGYLWKKSPPGMNE